MSPPTSCLAREFPGCPRSRHSRIDFDLISDAGFRGAELHASSELVIRREHDCNIGMSPQCSGCLRRNGCRRVRVDRAPRGFFLNPEMRLLDVAPYFRATTSPRPIARSKSSSACVAPNRFDTEISKSAGATAEEKSSIEARKRGPERPQRLTYGAVRSGVNRNILIRLTYYINA